LEIQINTIEKTGLNIAFEEETQTLPGLAEVEKTGEYKFLTPLNVYLRAFRVRDRINVVGDFKIDLGITCSRCLTEFRTALSDHFALTFTPKDPETEKHPENQEVELSPEEMVSIPYQGETIDFRAPIQEQVILALPIRALCSKKCKGLCLQCGADLNREKCSCKKLPSRSKFAALEKLKINK